MSRKKANKNVSYHLETFVQSVEKGKADCELQSRRQFNSSILKLHANLLDHERVLDNFRKTKPLGFD